jgi:hypothetical protein
LANELDVIRQTRPAAFRALPPDPRDATLARLDHRL